MNYKHIIRSLEAIKTSLSSILELGAESVLDAAIGRLKRSKAQYDKYQRRTDLSHKRVNDWGYEIVRRVTACIQAL